MSSITVVSDSVVSGSLMMMSLGHTLGLESIGHVACLESPSPEVKEGFEMLENCASSESLAVWMRKWLQHVNSPFSDTMLENGFNGIHTLLPQ